MASRRSVVFAAVLALPLVGACGVRGAVSDQAAPYAMSPEPADAAPAAPADGSKCPLGDAPMTWSASLKCSKGTGGCNISQSGTIVIKRTGKSSASVSAEGWTDTAGFDPVSCSVSHMGLKPKAPFDITVSYAVVIGPSGALSGSAQAVVKNSIFACSGQYAISGTKQ